MSGASRRQILVVDDDEAIRDSLAALLADEGYEVACVGDGEEALSLLHVSAAPDLILLDLMMPVLNGFAFRGRQQSDPRLAAIPTIALTAGNIDGRITNLGLAGWLRKPVSLDTLLQAIARCLHGSRSNGAAVMPACQPSAGHSVQFYRTDDQLADGVGAYLQAGLQQGEAVAVIATPSHSELFRARLAAAGVDVLGEEERGLLVFRDAHEVLASLTSGTPGAHPRSDRFDDRFDDQIRAILAGPDRGNRPIRIYGEMVDLLWADGDLAGAVALEALWNRFLAREGGTLHCAYSLVAEEELPVLISDDWGSPLNRSRRCRLVPWVSLAPGRTTRDPWASSTPGSGPMRTAWTIWSGCDGQAASAARNADTKAAGG